MLQQHKTAAMQMQSLFLSAAAKWGYPRLYPTHPKSPSRAQGAVLLGGQEQRQHRERQQKQEREKHSLFNCKVEVLSGFSSSTSISNITGRQKKIIVFSLNPSVACRSNNGRKKSSSSLHESDYTHTGPCFRLLKSPLAFEIRMDSL